MPRKTKTEIVTALAAVGLKVTVNRKEGKTETGVDKKPEALRYIEVLVPGKLWSRKDGDWCNKAAQRANEKRIYKLVKDAIGKEAYFDLICDDMGHSSTGAEPDDAHLQFYAYTAD